MPNTAFYSPNLRSAFLSHTASAQQRARRFCLNLFLVLAAPLAFFPVSTAQQASSPAPPATPSAQARVPAQSVQPPSNESSSRPEEAGGITEAELRQMLVGKFLYLRGGYLEDSLSFNEHGALIGRSPKGSYTLNVIRIERVHLTKHKVELEGARYGLHFLGALPSEDPANAIDRVRITPKKKEVKITIDREQVVKPKHKKEKDKGKQKTPLGAPGSASSAAPSAPADAAAAPNEQPQPATPSPEEGPADEASVTTTTSPAHATLVLKQALGNVFASSLDDRMMAAMPDFWKLYYQAAAAKTDFRPSDPGIIPDADASTQAKLLSNIDAPSDEFAQQCGVAGMALYQAVIGTDGTPEEISVARPIGFGLDENAVEAIRKAKFEPAMKDGKPVSVFLDLVVQFRIYSKRTAVSASSDAADKPAASSLPGPYSVQHPPSQPQ